MKLQVKPLIILSALMIIFIVCSAGCVSVQIKTDSTPNPTLNPTSYPSPTVTQITPSPSPTVTNTPTATFADITGKVFANRDVDGFGTVMTISVNAGSGAISLTVTPGKGVDYSLEDLGLSLSEIGSSDTLYVGKLSYVFNGNKLADNEYQLDRISSWIYTYDVPGYHGTSGAQIDDDTFLPDRGRLTIIDANTLSATFTLPELQIISKVQPVIFSY